MNILFCLDVKLIEKDGKYYTVGAADYEYFERFKNNKNDSVTVFCRKVKTHDMDKKMAISSGKGLRIICVNSFSDLLKKYNRELLKKLIIDADYRIVKLPTVIGSYASHLMRKKRISYTVNMVGCPWDALWNKDLKSKIIAPFFFLVTKYYTKHAAAVMYVTDRFLQKRYPTDGIEVGCSDVIIRSENSSVLKNRLDRINKIKAQEMMILGTIGAVDVEYKGQQYVLKAISELKQEGYNIEYQLVGDGNPEQLKELAKKYGIEGRVKIIGSLPHDEIFGWLDSIDIYIQPSELEGLCRSIVEAMSRACPVIASDVGGNNELIDQECIFKSKKVSDVKARIVSMSKNKMSKEAKRNFEYSKKFDEKVLRKKREDFFRKAVEL